jgi:hypothetical protein
MTNYNHSDAGKGSQDRSSVAARSASPLWKQVRLENGAALEPMEAASALNKIISIIQEHVIDNVEIDHEIKSKFVDWDHTYINSKL